LTTASQSRISGVFSYRHAIELYLKHLIFALNTILTTGETFKKNHSMIELWNEAANLNAAIEADLEMLTDRLKKC
jgi:hypothetical protein